jgi:hypothetical protein
MVPVYLGLIVLIFVTPRKQRQLFALSERSGKPSSNTKRDSDQRLSGDSTGEAEILNLADQSVADSVVNSLTDDPASSTPKPTGASAVKQWRGRARTRRTGKSASETVAVGSPVAWVRVGPGKFVRTDSTTQLIAEAQPYTQPDLCLTGDIPEAVSSAPTPPGPMETAEAAAELQNCGLLHTTGSNLGDVAVSHENVRGSAAEEHGIAPSALRPVLTILAPPNRLHYDVSPALSVWSLVGPDCLPRQSARRGLGWVVQLHRALRPRSPPHPGLHLRSKDQHGIAVAEKSITATDSFSIGSPN